MDPQDTQPTPEPTAAEPAAPEAPETPAAPAPEAPAAEPQAPWAPDRSQWEATQQFISQAAPFLGRLAEQMEYAQQQQYQQPQQQQQAPEFDPFEPQSVQEYINWQVEQRLGQAVAEQIGPYQPLFNSVASQQGEALANQALESIRSEIGDFHQDSAFLIAAGMIEQGAQPNDALRASAQFMAEYEKEIRASERERYQQELAELRNAPGETPAAGQTGEEMEKVPTGPRRYEEAVQRALARRNPQMPVG